MKNREKYFTKQSEYDLMMNIEQNTYVCPIRAVAGISSQNKIERCYRYKNKGCGSCIQEWLNEEAK